MKNIFLFAFLSISLIGCNKSDDTDQMISDPVLATLVLDPMSNIKGDFANGGGDVVDDGGSPISLKGICWGTSPNPDLENTFKAAGGGANAFTVELLGLEFNTTYYVRAFATNGAGTAFSEELSFTTTNECSVNLFEGDVFLSTQDEVEAFGANNYCGINGRLNLAEPVSGGSDFITDLTPLNNLRSVSRLEVHFTHELVDLSGLENLTVIDDYLGVLENEQLISLEGLNNVTSILGQIVVANNDVLRDVDGLSGLTSLEKPAESDTELTILGNTLLENIDGLSNISSVDESIIILIGSSDVMTHVNGISNISGTVQYIGITGLDNLMDLSGISGITRVTDDVIINNNFHLFDLSGMENLGFIGGDFQIRNNFDLRNLYGLSGLSTVNGNLLITNNGLVDFCGLQLLLSGDGLGGNYTVSDNNFNPSKQDIIDGNCVL